jgi:Zn-dependent peptidase ImmA (M78 family)
VASLKDPARIPARLAILASLGHTIKECQARWENITRTIGKEFKRSARDLLFPNSGEDLFLHGECANVALMFGSASPCLTPNDAFVLAGLLVNRKKTDGQLSSNHQPLACDKPWEQGYRLADNHRIDERVQGKPDAVDIEQCLRNRGVEIQDIGLSDISVRAVALADAAHAPVVAINTKHTRNQSSSGRRFTLAHELCHLLFDRPHGVSLRFISGEWAPVEVEKRANAFAAMTLMPPELIRAAAKKNKIRFDQLDEKKLKDLAKCLDVSPDALDHHLVNLRWTDVLVVRASALN